MGLSRKDYAGLASAIKRTLDDDSLNARREVLHKVAWRIVLVLRRHNHHFDYERFMAESGFSRLKETENEPLG